MHSHPGFLEQVKGVEPSSSAWKADVLAVVRHLQNAAAFSGAAVFILYSFVSGLSSRFLPVRAFAAPHIW